MSRSNSKRRTYDKMGISMRPSIKPHQRQNVLLAMDRYPKRVARKGHTQDLREGLQDCLNILDDFDGETLRTEFLQDTIMSSSHWDFEDALHELSRFEERTHEVNHFRCDPSITLRLERLLRKNAKALNNLLEESRKELQEIEDLSDY